MSIRDRLDEEYAPGWKPKPDDKLVGTITSIEMRTGGQYEDYPIVVVKPDDGDEVAVHAFHTVLRSEIARKKPEEGDRIGIKYLGRTDSARGGYENYRVVLETDRATKVDWDTIGTQADAELAPTSPTAPSSYGPEEAPF